MIVDQSSAKWQLKIRQQYDSFCKMVLKNEMIDYEREKKYREKKEGSRIDVLFFRNDGYRNSEV